MGYFLLFHLLEIICLSCVFCHHLIYDDLAWTTFCKRHMCKLFLCNMKEKGANEIVFKAMGRAINKTVMIVELIKVFYEFSCCSPSI